MDSIAFSFQICVFHAWTLAVAGAGDTQPSRTLLRPWGPTPLFIPGQLWPAVGSAAQAAAVLASAAWWRKSSWRMLPLALPQSLQPYTQLLGGWPTDWTTIIPKKFSHCCDGSRPHTRLANVLLLLLNHSVVSDSLRPRGLQHARLPCPSPSPGACSNSCPLNQWCHPSISSSVVPFSSRLGSFPATGSFLMSWLSSSGGQSIGVSVSASVLLMNIQDWFPLGLTGSNSLLFKGLSRVFSITHGDLAKGLGIPREPDFEGQQDLIRELL